MAWVALHSLFEREAQKYTPPPPSAFGMSPRKRARGGGSGTTKARQVPVIISHCVLAVKKKGKSSREAWNICRAQLTKQEYLKGPYKTKARIPKDVKPSQKGVRRGMKHAMEKDAPKKFNKFKDVMRDIETGT